MVQLIKEMIWHEHISSWNWWTNVCGGYYAIRFFAEILPLKLSSWTRSRFPITQPKRNKHYQDLSQMLLDNLLHMFTRFRWYCLGTPPPFSQVSSPCDLPGLLTHTLHAYIPTDMPTYRSIPSNYLHTLHIWMIPKIMLPQNGWWKYVKIMVPNPMNKWDDLGGNYHPLFLVQHPYMVNNSYFGADLWSFASTCDASKVGIDPRSGSHWSTGATPRGFPLNKSGR